MGASTKAANGFFWLSANGRGTPKFFFLGNSHEPKLGEYGRCPPSQRENFFPCPETHPGVFSVAQTIFLCFGTSKALKKNTQTAAHASVQVKPLLLLWDRNRRQIFLFFLGNPLDLPRVSEGNMVSEGCLVKMHAGHLVAAFVESFIHFPPCMCICTFHGT